MKTCPKHPKYKPTKLPKKPCEVCASIYLAIKGTRKPIPKPGRVHKSVKTYSRKSKHRTPII